jgi:hypothetical protein
VDAEHHAASTRADGVSISVKVDADLAKHQISTISALSMLIVVDVHDGQNLAD